MTSSTAARVDVSLTIPAHERYIAPARVLSASLAADLDMSVDEIEELRIGLDEVLSLLVEAVGRQGTITVAFFVGDTDLSVEASTSEACMVDPDDLSLHILSAVVDEHEIGDDVVRIRKQRGRTGS